MGSRCLFSLLRDPTITLHTLLTEQQTWRSRRKIVVAKIRTQIHPRDQPMRKTLHHPHLDSQTSLLTKFLSQILAGNVTTKISSWTLQPLSNRSIVLADVRTKVVKVVAVRREKIANQENHPCYGQPGSTVPGTQTDPHQVRIRTCLGTYVLSCENPRNPGRVASLLSL